MASFRRKITSETVKQTKILLKEKQVIFWDFDGVIKDSVKVKSTVFGLLFAPFGDDVVKQVREHHEANGGLSRFDKLPIYLGWAGCLSTPELVEEYSNKFSILVKHKVIESNWVPGVLEFIRNKTNKQSYFIISATPQDEIEEIIQKNTITTNNIIITIASPHYNRDWIINNINTFCSKEFFLKQNFKL